MVTGGSIGCTVVGGVGRFITKGLAELTLDEGRAEAYAWPGRIEGRIGVKGSRVALGIDAVLSFISLGLSCRGGAVVVALAGPGRATATAALGGLMDRIMV